jgi:hypothetical protein
MIHSESKDLDNNQIRILNPHQASKLNIRIAPNGIFYGNENKNGGYPIEFRIDFKVRNKGNKSFVSPDRWAYPNKGRGHKKVIE